MLIAGLQRGHDASATLILDGDLKIVSEAERVLGVKHATGLGAAAAALTAALDHVGVSSRDVDAIIIADSNRDNFEQVIPVAREKTHSEDLLYKLGTVSYLRQVGGEVGVPGLRHDCEIFGVCHHLAHAMGAYFMSGFTGPTGAIVVDGYGTCAATMAFRLDGCSAKILPKWTDRFLLGWRYQLFGEFIREIDKAKTLPLDLAGKVMGLQAYGEADNAEYFKRWLSGGLEDYRTCWQAGSRIFFEDLDECGGFTRDSTTARDPAYLNALASMQSAFTDILCETVREVVHDAECERVVISGGCALNVVSNTALARFVPESDLFIPPNPGDSGLSLGAAVIGAGRLDLCHDPFATTAKSVKRSAYNGLRVTYDVSWQDVAKQYRVAVFPEDSSSTGEALAAGLKQGRIVGVVHGRCEIGPRALGHRSIIANPAFPGMKDLINQKIKKREWWRPFAPMCRTVDASRYFEIIRPCSYMLYSAYVREAWRERLPAITHVDMSARLQVIGEKADNVFLWDVMTALEESTGCGVLLNTSFNLAGRPIVNSLSEVICMLGTSEIDAVWIEGHLIYKDTWASAAHGI